MVELIRPLLDRMNRFLEAAFPGHVAFCELVNDRGRPIFQLGWIFDGARRYLPALSGGESGLFCAALGYALVVLADPPLKLLLIEASELDIGMFGRLCNGIEAVESELDSVMVATHLGSAVHLCEPTAVDSTPWNIHQLNGELVPA